MSDEPEANIEAIRASLIEGEATGKADYSLEGLEALLDQRRDQAYTHRDPRFLFLLPPSEARAAAEQRWSVRY